jgi:hypothetical protein
MLFAAVHESGCVQVFGPHAMSDLSPLCAPKQTSVDYSKHYRRLARSNETPNGGPQPLGVTILQPLRSRH